MNPFCKRKLKVAWLWAALLLLGFSSAGYADPPPGDAPSSPHHSPLTTHHSPLTTHHSPLTTSERLARINTAVRQAIEHGDMPGAVVLIVHRGQIVFREAYGFR